MGAERLLTDEFVGLHAWVEHWWADGLPVRPMEVTSFTKTRLLMELDRDLLGAHLTMISHPTLLAQMGACEWYSNPHRGQIKYVMDNHAPDFALMAVALAWHAASKYTLRRIPFSYR
jgi:hypothetical protein